MAYYTGEIVVSICTINSKNTSDLQSIDQWKSTLLSENYLALLQHTWSCDPAHLVMCFRCVSAASLGSAPAVRKVLLKLERKVHTRVMGITSWFATNNILKLCFNLIRSHKLIILQKEKEKNVLHLLWLSKFVIYNMAHIGVEDKSFIHDIHSLKI